MHLYLWEDFKLAIMCAVIWLYPWTNKPPAAITYLVQTTVCFPAFTFLFWIIMFAQNCSWFSDTYCGRLYKSMQTENQWSGSELICCPLCRGNYSLKPSIRVLSRCGGSARLFWGKTKSQTSLERTNSSLCHKFSLSAVQFALQFYIS